MAKTNAAADTEPTQAEAATTSAPKRKIPGNLPYLTSSGTMKTALERIIDPQQPPKYNADFLENVLNIKGGAGRATVSVMKKMGFITSDGTPTELYTKFRTNSGRGSAALQGLQTAFSEIFKRSTYAHTVPDAKLKDLIIEVTHLSPNDPVVTAIRGTFNAIKSFVTPDASVATPANDAPKQEEIPSSDRQSGNSDQENGGGIRLAYNINIVLPETSDLNVLNAIFRSIRENLMR